MSSGTFQGFVKQVIPEYNPSGDTTGITDSALLNTFTTPGEYLLGAGTWYLNSTFVFRTGIVLVGEGIGVTILKLANGANTDLISTLNFASLTGGNATTGAPTHFGLKNLSCDGNRQNNTSGWTFRIFGSAYIIENVDFHDGKSGGVWTEWGTGGSDMEAFWSKFKVFDSEGVDFEFRGPHDSQFSQGIIYRSGAFSYGVGGGNQHHLNIQGNGSGTLWEQIHIYGPADVGIVTNTQTKFENCISDGAGLIGIQFLASGCSWIGGEIFGTNGSASATEVGIQLGINPGTFVSQIVLGTPRMWNYGASGKPIDWQNCDNSIIDVVGHVNASTVPITYGVAPSASVWRTNFDATNGMRYRFPDGRLLEARGGIVLKQKAGAPVDGDFSGNGLQDGIFMVDTTNNKIWVRIGGVWKGVVVA